MTASILFYLVFSSTFTSVREQRFENINYRLIDLRSET